MQSLLKYLKELYFTPYNKLFNVRFALSQNDPSTPPPPNIIS